MNHQNIPKSNTSIPVPDLPAKRKRGRPRKDENIPRKDQKTQMPVSTPASVAVPRPSFGGGCDFRANTHQVKLNPIPNPNKIDTSMVGQAVSGVIEGTFDGGYLVAIRVGPNNNLLRGVVFQQGHFAPVTPANDVAPHVKMYQRSEFPVAGYNNNNPKDQVCPTTKQPVNVEDQAMASMVAHQVVAMELQNAYRPAPISVHNPLFNTPKDDLVSSLIPRANLTMVEQDDVMQVFEVSKMLHEPKPSDFQLSDDNMVREPLVPEARLEMLPRTDDDQDEHIGNKSFNPEQLEAKGASVENKLMIMNAELVPPQNVVSESATKVRTCHGENPTGTSAENDTTGMSEGAISKNEHLDSEFAEPHIFTSACQSPTDDILNESRVSQSDNS